MADTPVHLSGLAGVAAAYDGFILDIWGVVHDGVRLFPRTAATLQELKAARRRVWLLSNVPRRAAVVREQLAAMGVAPGLYDGITTSGETAHAALRDVYLPQWGRRCFYIGAAGRVKHDDATGSIRKGLDLAAADTPEEADFVFNQFYDVHGHPPAPLRPLLERCLARGLPMVCANPDRMVHVGDDIRLCPGALADLYEDMGGKVLWFGKPHRAVYAHALEGIGAQKVLAVGDGMQTDIAGARGAGLDCALVLTGIHRAEEGLFEKYPWRPTYTIDRLSW